MPDYKLLTPGPLTTTDTVKKEMMFDHCTWDDDYKQITQKIRKELLRLAHVSEEEYTVVLMQGSGTFGVESVIGSSVGDQEKLLVCANGAYGDTVSDIKEGLAAGMLSLGIVEGSSVMGLTEAEYAALSPEEQAGRRRKVEEKFLAAGASAVLRNLSELPAYLEGLER